MISWVSPCTRVRCGPRSSASRRCSCEQSEHRPRSSIRKSCSRLAAETPHLGTNRHRPAGPSTAELRRAGDSLRAADAGALREAAHRIFGMVSAVSSQAGAVASELEDQAALGQLNPAAPLLARLTLMSDDLLAMMGDLSIDGLQSKIELCQ